MKISPRNVFASLFAVLAAGGAQAEDQGFISKLFGGEKKTSTYSLPMDPNGHPLSSLAKITRETDGTLSIETREHPLGSAFTTCVGGKKPGGGAATAEEMNRLQ